jgi:hypothetical protein
MFYIVDLRAVFQMAAGGVGHVKRGVELDSWLT